jgi:hypothetical protein
MLSTDSEFFKNTFGLQRVERESEEAEDMEG